MFEGSSLMFKVPDVFFHHEKLFWPKEEGSLVKPIETSIFWCSHCCAADMVSWFLVAVWLCFYSDLISFFPHHETSCVFGFRCNEVVENHKISSYSNICDRGDLRLNFKINLGVHYLFYSPAPIYRVITLSLPLKNIPCSSDISEKKMSKYEISLQKTFLTFVLS